MCLIVSSFQHLTGSIVTALALELKGNEIGAIISVNLISKIFTDDICLLDGNDDPQQLVDAVHADLD